MSELVDIVIDFETTGFSLEKHVITEIGAVAVSVATGAFLSQGVMRVKISREELNNASIDALNVNGWTPELNETGLPLADVQRQFHAWLDSFGTNIRGHIAHMASFDKRFAHHFRMVNPSIPWFCTKKGLGHLRKRGSVRAPDDRLETLLELCGYRRAAEHRALDDALGAANGWRYELAFGLSPADMAA